MLVNMAFNLGISGLKTFRLMIAAIERQDWVDAAREGLDSRWSGQVGDRAIQTDAGAKDRAVDCRRPECRCLADDYSPVPAMDTSTEDGYFA